MPPETVPVGFRLDRDEALLLIVPSFDLANDTDETLIYGKECGYLVM